MKLRAPLASPVAWVVSLGPVGQARLQLKSCTKNSMFFGIQNYFKFTNIQGRISEVVPVFSLNITRVTLASEHCVVSEDWHLMKT